MKQNSYSELLSYVGGVESLVQCRIEVVFLLVEEILKSLKEKQLLKVQRHKFRLERIPLVKP